jgi:hypothetical protein
MINKSSSNNIFFEKQSYFLLLVLRLDIEIGTLSIQIFVIIFNIFEWDKMIPNRSMYGQVDLSTQILYY